MIASPGMLRPFALAFFAAYPAAAPAQSLVACDGWQASAQNVVEPWERFSRSFANGDIRVALLDNFEPAVAAHYLLVLTPPHDEFGGRTCALVAEDEGHGFAGIDFETISASYDPAVGLTLAMPVQRFMPDMGEFTTQRLSVTFNQATGEIRPDLR